MNAPGSCIGISVPDSRSVAESHHKNRGGKSRYVKRSCRGICRFAGRFQRWVEQSLGDPLGKRGTEILQWFFHTRTFWSVHGQEGGSAGDIDDDHRAMDNFGAFILGRNMFSPVRGPWLDDSWKGW
jgi:hypothetical protein